jgi:FtsH-binding integral membrane protein
MSNSQDERLLKAYEELCTSYRAIDDFRAKLLGFLPLASGTGILLSKNNIASQAESFLIAIGVFGFLVTLGLFSYEIYGIKKCAALIETGERMEGLLQVEGQFRKRPQNFMRVINEPFAAGVIYPTVLAAWAFLTLTGAWPESNPWISILIFTVGFASTLIYDYHLRKPGKAKHGQKGEHAGNESL